MENHTSQNRQQTLSDADAVFINYHKRVKLTPAHPTIYVENATATGSGRILNGIVHRDNVHGNSSTIINNFHAGTHGASGLAEAPKSSGILSTDQRKQLLERLRFPQLDARLANLRKAQSYTCKWIRERKDYKKWLDSNDLQASDGFFWIKGNPGTGKSILMKFLYQAMQRQLRQATAEDKLVISFFFNARGNEFEKSTLGLYRSLLFNLLNLEPSLQEALDLCERAGYHNILESDWQLQMLKEVFEEAITLLQAQGKQLYCFVDALDECPDDEVQDMVSYFEELVSSTNSQHFRVCFSSRHYPQIAMRTRLTITLEKEPKHKEDIEIFLESQLLFGDNPAADILQEIKAEILEKSSGIFLWVNLVVHQLNEVHRRDGRITAVQQRLRNIPAAAMKQAAPNEAIPLYGLFEDIIRKDKKRIDELVRITQIVFCARRPMHPRELYVLLHQEFHVPFDSSEIPDVFITKYVLEISKGLAEVAKSEEPTVQFIHETVREFLRDGGLNSIFNQSIDRAGHRLLMASCLEQINGPLSEYLEVLASYRRQGDFRNSEVHGVTYYRQKVFQEQANEKFPFLEYATKNIFFHAEELEAMKVSQNQVLKSFPIDEWIPLHNLFQKTDAGRYALNTPILYILAGLGCDHLIKSSAKFTGQYALEIRMNSYPSSLAYAICINHLDTAWKLVLVGLNARARPLDIVAPSEMQVQFGDTLIRTLLQRGGSRLMRRVLEYRYAMRISEPAKIVFDLATSAEMIDLLLEVSDVPGFPSVGYHQRYPQTDREALKPPCSNSGLVFIRKAIETEPSLLESEAWGGQTMCNYAVSKGWVSLVSLFLEYSGSGQSEVDAVLHQAVKSGQLEIIKLATQRGANLTSQDKNGNTALHVAMMSAYDCYSPEHSSYMTPGPEQGDKATVGEAKRPRYGSRGLERHDRHEWEEIVQYLISEDASCVKMRDLSGWTPVHLMKPTRDFTKPAWDTLPNSILETFVQAEADVNAVSKCSKCPRSEGHEVPLATFLLLGFRIEMFEKLASDDRCDLNGRDNFGRTALSWCFAYRHGETKLSGHHSDFWLGQAGEFLLQRQEVDVNSRDDSGYTILEHFIRYPFCTLRSHVSAFFQSEGLNSNLQMSNGQHPLELIVSLYNTWPIEFGEIGEIGLTHELFLNFRIEKPTGTAMDRRRERSQQKFNLHLIQATEHLLGTGKVEIEVQRRCVDQAPSELREAILDSIQVSC